MDRPSAKVTSMTPIHCSPSPSSRRSLYWLTVATLAVGGFACGGDDGSAPAAESEGSGGTSAGPGGNGTQGADTTGAATEGSGGAEQGTGEVTTNDPDDTGGTETGGTNGIACIDEQYVGGVGIGANYSDFEVSIGSHCNGTNQQDITEIERIVFIGDSVTVGTPPTTAPDFYRTILANALATAFGLEPPEQQWTQVNLLEGTASLQESGAFASCAVWGAQNDDLAAQLEDCFAVEDFPMRTLVVFTMGGNDGASIAKDYLDGAPLADVFDEVETMIAQHEAAVQWLVGDPDKFPNGVFVVNANVYEFTDGTFDFLSCPAASLAGFNSNPDMPDILLSSLRHINEEYMRIAAENGTDVVFMSEGFCGHGFHAGDESSTCYRGPDNETWFDLSCIHPTPAGHEALAAMFLDVISE